MNSEIKKQIKIPAKVENFLVRSEIKYELIGHRTVFTAIDKAATLKIKAGAVAKVLAVKTDGELALAVIGGDRNLDVDKLLKLARAKKIDFAKEKIISQAFKGIDPGAVPPFGGLWQIPVFCDKKLLESAKIILSAGSYEMSIKITPATFKKANTGMIVGNFSSPRRSAAKAGAVKPRLKKPVKSALKKRTK